MCCRAGARVPDDDRFAIGRCAASNRDCERDCLSGRRRIGASRGKARRVVCRHAIVERRAAERIHAVHERRGSCGNGCGQRDAQQHHVA